MAVLFVVSVANAIKVARHQRSEISVVLPIVKLNSFTKDLGDGIRFICFF